MAAQFEIAVGAVTTVLDLGLRGDELVCQNDSAAGAGTTLPRLRLWEGPSWPRMQSYFSLQLLKHKHKSHSSIWYLCIIKL